MKKIVQSCRCVGLSSLALQSSSSNCLVLMLYRQLENLIHIKKCVFLELTPFLPHTIPKGVDFPKMNFLCRSAYSMQFLGKNYFSYQTPPTSMGGEGWKHDCADLEISCKSKLEAFLVIDPAEPIGWGWQTWLFCGRSANFIKILEETFWKWTFTPTPTLLWAGWETWLSYTDLDIPIPRKESFSWEIDPYPEHIPMVWRLANMIFLCRSIHFF